MASKKNNKGLNYILLLVVACIWGYIGYSIFGGEKTTLFSTPSSTKTHPKSSTIDNTEFTIQTNYEDPFLGKLKTKHKSKSNFKSTNPTTQHSQKAAKKTSPQSSTINWPNIEYSGKISNNGKTVYFLKVDGRDAYVGKNTIIEDIKVIDFNNVEIVLEKENEQRKFSIELE